VSKTTGSVAVMRADGRPAVAHPQWPDCRLSFGARGRNVKVPPRALVPVGRRRGPSGAALARVRQAPGAVAARLVGGRDRIPVLGKPPLSPARPGRSGRAAPLGRLVDAGGREFALGGVDHRFEVAEVGADRLDLGGQDDLELVGDRPGRQPPAATLRGRELRRRLVVARLPVELVLGRVDRLGLLDDLSRQLQSAGPSRDGLEPTGRHPDIRRKRQRPPSRYATLSAVRALSRIIGVLLYLTSIVIAAWGPLPDAGAIAAWIVINLGIGFWTSRWRSTALALFVPAVILAGPNRLSTDQVLWLALACMASAVWLLAVGVAARRSIDAQLSP
jgi:hypothetical protein